jgi:hypothetical protein
VNQIVGLLKIFGIQCLSDCSGGAGICGPKVQQQFAIKFFIPLQAFESVFQIKSRQKGRKFFSF